MSGGLEDEQGKTMKRRVGVIMGGVSAEREVSLRTGEGIGVRPRGPRARRGAHHVQHGGVAAGAPSHGAHRRGLHRAPRARRGGRVCSGPARAARHPVHRVGRARLGARDGQAQGEGDVPSPQRADAAVLRRTRSRPCGSRGSARELRLSGDREATRRGIERGREQARPASAELCGGHRRTRSPTTRAFSSSASSRRPRCMSAS